MTLILAIVPVLLLIVLMAFFKMPGDKSSVISLIVTILIVFFGIPIGGGRQIWWLIRIRCTERVSPSRLSS